MQVRKLYCLFQARVTGLSATMSLSKLPYDKVDVSNKRVLIRCKLI